MLYVIIYRFYILTNSEKRIFKLFCSQCLLSAPRSQPVAAFIVPASLPDFSISRATARFSSRREAPSDRSSLEAPFSPMKRKRSCAVIFRSASLKMT